MVATGMEVVVPPPALTPRMSGTLLTSAAIIPGMDTRLASGVKFRSHGTQDLMREGVVLCTPPTVDRTFDASNSDIRVFSSFAVYADEACSVLAVDEADLRVWANVRLSAFESAQVANELLTGAATGNDSLHNVGGTDVTVVTGAATKVTSAMAQVEEELSERLHGAVGMIHVTPGVLYALNAGGGLEHEEADENEAGEANWPYERWLTPSGHIVVADAGYDGASPAGVAATVGQSYVYGSGLVEYALSDLRPLGVGNQILNLTHDDRRYILTREAVVRFDPETAFAALFDLT